MSNSTEFDMIAKRVFERAGTLVILEIARPRSFSDKPDSDFYCEYRFTNLPEIPDVRRAGGVDAVQALQMVMQAIRQDLKTVRGLTWDAGAVPSDLGLPRLDPNEGRRRLKQLERSVRGRNRCDD